MLIFASVSRQVARLNIRNLFFKLYVDARCVAPLGSNIEERFLVKQYLSFASRQISLKEANLLEARGSGFDEIPSLSDSPGRLEAFARGGGGAGRKRKVKSEVGEKKSGAQHGRQSRHVVCCRLKNAEDERRGEGV